MMKFFQTQKNKKGFTLIELIIVIAILAILVALLAPNVMKYLEKSRVSKDKNSLDSVYTVVKAELMDENVYQYDTDGKAVSLASLKTAAAGAEDDANKVLGLRLFGTADTLDQAALDAKFAENSVFKSNAAVDANALIYIVVENGKVGVAALDAEGNLVEYDGTALYVGDLDQPTSFTIAGADNTPADPEEP